jgi:hypothetical protein
MSGAMEAESYHPGVTNWPGNRRVRDGADPTPGRFILSIPSGQEPCGG